MTVSRALNTPQLVRPKTVEKVMQAVRATGYIPNALAGGLASRRSKLIAIVVPQINNNMFVDTIQSLSDELARRGYHILLCVAGYTEQTEAELVATLLSRRPDGVVLTGIHHTSELKKVILNARLFRWSKSGISRQRRLTCWSVSLMKKSGRPPASIC